MREAHAKQSAKLVRLLNVVSKLLERGEISEDVQSRFHFFRFVAVYSLVCLRWTVGAHVMCKGVA